MSKRVTLAITGASGSVYGIRLISALAQAGFQVHLMISDAARIVLATEMGIKVPKSSAKAAQVLVDHLSLDAGLLEVHGNDNWFAPVASGSSAPKAMVICPCSTGTVAAVAQGQSDNLIERAADVVIKEKGKLVIVPRESPLSSLHLRNMLALSDLGAVILPASPGFYHQPQSIDDLVNFIVARVLDHLGIEQDLVKPWGYQPS